MKTIALAATVALLSTGTAFAQNLSAADFAAQHFAQDYETGDGARLSNTVEETGVVVSSSNRVSDSTAFAIAHFAGDHERGDGARIDAGTDNGTVVFSTSDSALSAKAEAILAAGNGPEDKR